MSLINITGLTFSYDGSYTNVFEDVSFHIDTDWKLGFIGRNGRGKTTFLNLLLGKYEYKGVISSSVSFDYFPFDITDKSQKTIDVIYGISDNFELWQVSREFSMLDVAEDVLYRPFNTLSNGERTKVLLAILFLKENNFLLIDEPTNHLDLNARTIISDYLRSKKGFILVSHDRKFLDNCVDHILSINKTDIEIQKGNFSSWWINKQLQDNFEIVEDDKLKKSVKKLSEAAKRVESWSDRVEKSKNQKLSSGLSADKGYIGHKSAKMMKSSKTIDARRQSALEEKSKLLKNLETSGDLSIRPMGYHTNRLLEIEHLSIFYGDRAVCEDISFAINSGDRAALQGRNGCGKSTLLKLLIGEKISFSGKLNIGSNLIISYISQDTSFLKGDLKEFARNSNIEESLFKTILRKLDFTREQFEKDISDFSSGQKKKVLIAKSLCERAHLYIWDEPLNFIDVISRMQIETLLLEYKPTMLFVEHDRAFIDEVSTKVVMI